MRIPLPCAFGQTADCEGKSLPLVGVSWFCWSRGMEYNYFFKRNMDVFCNTDFYATFETSQPCGFDIPDTLLMDMPIKEHGYPLRGKGHACGIAYVNGKTYMEFIIISNYYEHIRAECDADGRYVPGGNIIFPTGWDEEKKERAVLKSFMNNHKQDGSASKTEGDGTGKKQQNDTGKTNRKLKELKLGVMKL